MFRIHGKDPASYTPNLEEGVEFYHPDDRDTVRGEIERVREHGGEFQFKLRLVIAEDKTIDVESFGLARQDSSGEVRRIIGVFRALD